MSVPYAWYDDWETFYAVLSHAVSTGAVTDVAYLMGVIEKPWNYDELLETWEKETADD
jgi:hypothetical protein